MPTFGIDIAAAGLASETAAEATIGLGAVAADAGAAAAAGGLAAGIGSETAAEAAVGGGLAAAAPAAVAGSETAAELLAPGALDIAGGAAPTAASLTGLTATPISDVTTGALATPAAGTAAAPAGASAASGASTLGPAGGAALDPTALNADVLTGAAAPGAGASDSGVGALFPGQGTAANSSVVGLPAGGTAAPSAVSPPLGIETPTQPQSFLSQAGDYVTKAIGKQNPLTLAVGGAGLLRDLIMGGQTPKGENAVSAEAAQLAGQGRQLSEYLSSGTLPPGAQAAIDQYVKAGTAGINSKYASMGVDPNTSTAAAEEINALRLNAEAQSFNIADSLLTQGINESQISAGLFGDLVKMNQQQATDTGNAISSFTTALALNGLKIPGGTNANA